MLVPLAVGIRTAVAAACNLRCLQRRPPLSSLKLCAMLSCRDLAERSLYGAAACREALTVAASCAPRQPPLVCDFLRMFLCVPAVVTCKSYGLRAVNEACYARFPCDMIIRSPLHCSWLTDSCSQ